MDNTVALQRSRLKKQKGIETIFHSVFLIFGLFSIAFVLFISIFLIISGVHRRQQTRRLESFHSS